MVVALNLPPCGAVCAEAAQRRRLHESEHFFAGLLGISGARDLTMYNATLPTPGGSVQPIRGTIRHSKRACFSILATKDGGRSTFRGD